MQMIIVWLISWKKLRFFPIFIKNLKFQTTKEARSETDQKRVVSKEYYNLLNMFSKKNLDTLSLYQKYAHKILLKEE